MLAYAAGLRISEAASLRVADIDSQRMVIRVVQGKRKKDRYTLLSPLLLQMLRHYWWAAASNGLSVPWARAERLRPLQHRTARLASTPTSVPAWRRT